jgi:hypothetical protein
LSQNSRPHRTAHPNTRACKSVALLAAVSGLGLASRAATAGTLVNEDYATAASHGWTMNVDASANPASLGIRTATSSELAAQQQKVFTFDPTAANQENFQTGSRTITPNATVPFADKVFVLRWSSFSTIGAASTEFYKTQLQLTDPDGAGVQLVNNFNTNGSLSNRQPNQLKSRQNTLTIDPNLPNANTNADGTALFYNGIYANQATPPLGSGTTNRSVEDTTQTFGTLYNQEAVVRLNDTANFNINVEWSTLNPGPGGTSAIQDMVVGNARKTTITKDNTGAVIDTQITPITSFTRATITATRPGIATSGGVAAVSYADANVYHGEPDGTVNAAARNHQVGFGRYQLVETVSSDFNRDLKTDLDDASILIANFNTAGAKVMASGDADNDADTDLDDASRLIAKFGQSHDVVAGSAAASLNLVDGSIRLDSKDVALYKIFIGDANHNQVSGTDLLSLDAGQAGPRPARGPVDAFGTTTKQNNVDGAQENFGEFLTSNQITTTSDFDLATSELVDTNVNVDVANLLLSGNRLWLQYQTVGNEPVFVEVAVPEPGAAGLALSLAAAGMLRRRRPV